MSTHDASSPPLVEHDELGGIVIHAHKRKAAGRSRGARSGTVASIDDLAHPLGFTAMHANRDKRANDRTDHRMQKRIALDGKRQDVLAKRNLMAKLGAHYAAVRRFAHGRSNLAKALEVLLAQQRGAGSRHSLNIQGIAMPPHRTAGHTHYRIPVQNLGYMGRLCYTQNVTAVTGACLLVKKSLYEQVGGLDESFVISLNDVDFCLKLRKLGLLNVWTPFAELYHYESISRGLDDQGEKAERYNKESEHFREKWKTELEAGDPYYNPNFSLDRSDYALKDPAVS